MLEAVSLTTGVFALLGFAAGCGLLAWQQRRQQLDWQQKFDQMASQLGQRACQVAELEATLTAERAATAEKIQLLHAARESLAKDFEVLANRLLDEKSKQFSELNQRQLDSTLKPFKINLDDFKARIETVYKQQNEQAVSLKTELGMLKELNVKMTSEAERLVDALKGNSKTQGDFGEMILESLLSGAGLREGSEYSLQHEFRSDDNRRLRPDVIVHLPDSRIVIIDSKVSLTAYERLCASTQEDERQQWSGQHVRSLKAHIKGLADKGYHKIPEYKTLDFVLMFVPIEGAMLSALSAEPAIFQEAYDRGIILVGPTNLLMTLRIIREVWRYEQQNQNVQKIVKGASDLYDKLAAFVQDMEGVGSRLDQAQDSFEKAMNKLAKGRGNVLTRAESLVELGAVPTKRIARALLDNDETAESL